MRGTDADAMCPSNFRKLRPWLSFTSPANPEMTTPTRTAIVSVTSHGQVCQDAPQHRKQRLAQGRCVRVRLAADSGHAGPQRGGSAGGRSRSVQPRGQPLQECEHDSHQGEMVTCTNSQ